MEKIFFEGFFLQASLIFALGSQNIFILESGLKRENHLLASFFCFVCDLCLILLGVAGAATILSQMPGLKIFIGIVGVYFLFTYGLEKLVSKDYLVTSSASSSSGNFKKCLLLAITFSLLNPHAYLDAFILIGGVSTKYSSLDERLIFGLGAAIYSGVWFLLLSNLASYMKPIFNNQRQMKYVMAITGCFLIFLSLNLALDVKSWIAKDVDQNFVSKVNYPAAPGIIFSSILY